MKDIERSNLRMKRNTIFRLAHNIEDTNSYSVGDSGEVSIT